MRKDDDDFSIGCEIEAVCYEGTTTIRRGSATLGEHNLNAMPVNGLELFNFDTDDDLSSTLVTVIYRTHINSM